MEYPAYLLHVGYAYMFEKSEKGRGEGDELVKF
jgi:hypothetical protein